MYSLIKLAFLAACLALAVIGLLYVGDVISFNQLGGVAARTFGAIGILFLVAVVMRSVLAGREVRDESDQRVP